MHLQDIHVDFKLFKDKSKSALYLMLFFLIRDPCAF